jgi:NAD+ synthase (glutamine-hydrolysing)
MRLALAQINPLIGDFSGNLAKITQFIDQAYRRHCDLVIFPELALLGYPPRDLLDNAGFVRDSLRYWPPLRDASRRIGIICGAVTENENQTGKPYHNSALFFCNGELRAKVHKQLLPSYDVFDEERYFEPGTTSGWVDFAGQRLGITICEDIWNVSDFLPHFPYGRNPVLDLARASAEILVNISASPYHARKIPHVNELLKSHAERFRMQVVYVNQVGGNDELIFQGHSMAWDATGKPAACAADFREDLITYDTRAQIGDGQEAGLDSAAEMIEALVLGLGDYTRKCGFEKVVLGLSGGVDSSLVACLATLALGPEQVLGVALPGPYSAPESLTDARELAHRLKIRFEVIPISDQFRGLQHSLAPVFGNLPPDVTEENLQARLRGVVLMALSNKFHRLLLSTGNKSELAVGYCTLYGDMNGGLAVIGDVPKTTVFALAHSLNRQYGWIPDRVLARPPSAELRPDQKDEDTLPPYPILDGILTAYIEKSLDMKSIIDQGFDAGLVEWVVRQVDGNEYKRWQAPPVLRVSPKAFGMGRRLPIAHGYREGNGLDSKHMG